MPELPDVELYVTRLQERLIGQRLQTLSIYNPFVLRSVTPKKEEFQGRQVTGVSRLGKRIVLEFEEEYYAIIHLMIAGRFTWRSPLPPDKRPSGKLILASFRFDAGQLSLQEISTQKRASIYLVYGAAQLDDHRRDGLNLFATSREEFQVRLKERNRTLKRALTDPNAFDGVGNAFSDEILFAARLSPVRLTGSLDEVEMDHLLEGARTCLRDWTERLQSLYPEFPRPTDVTAFRPDFAVHGRFGKPCPVCGAPIQRIVYAANETNYCARCQNEGRLLADRSLSRLLKSDWPRTLEELMAD